MPLIKNSYGQYFEWNKEHLGYALFCGDGLFRPDTGHGVYHILPVLVNCIVGMITGMLVEREGFRLRKFIHCISETLAFYLIVVCLFVVGRNMNNMDGAMQAIGGVIYSILYFYSVNVLRNLTYIFPDSRTLVFLYYVVSFEFIKKIPALQRFNDYCKEHKKDNDEKD